MLEVTGLHRAYGAYVAVDHLSFSIGAGEIVGLLGHNGAGKTTIMKMLSGYLEPDAGQIRIDGIDLADDPQAVKRRLGYLPESLPVYPELSVIEYLEYAAGLKGIAKSERPRAIRRAIEATDLTAKLVAPIGTLSRGQKQRVGVAQALLGEPRLLILDEPTNGLDPNQTKQMRQLIRELAKQATVILSTHIMQEVEALCDRVLILRDGRLVVDEPLSRIRRSETLLLESNIDPDALKRLLRREGLGQLDRFTPQSGGHRFRIRLTDADNFRQHSARLSRLLVNDGHALFCLQPEQRDLESLFREANSDHSMHVKEALDHVA